MFAGFATRRVKTSGAEIFLRHAGRGPGVLLIHGYPQTHAVWHRVAPALTGSFTVVCPDLRGYGASTRPQADAAHTVYSKRAMALDLVEVMETLGFTRFAVVGHDRGARVAYRLALDHPARTTALCSLDVVPTSETWWDRIDMTRALGGFHWQLLAQPEPLPERLISADPDFFMEWLLRAWAAPGFTFAPDALSAYREAFRDPAVVHATCEDYRAGATVDYLQDLQDRRTDRKISCPVLALSGEADAVGKPTGFLDIWRQWADDVTGGGVTCGHFLPEEAPDDVLARLEPFLKRVLIGR
jgi:haloacetate dehalogenase